MTYNEYITATLSKFYISPEEIDVIMLNQNITPDEDVDPKIAKMAMYKEFSQIIPVANMSEGGASTTWNMKSFLLWYSLLASELGEPDMTKEDNTIKDYSAYY